MILTAALLLAAAAPTSSGVPPHTKTSRHARRRHASSHVGNANDPDAFLKVQAFTISELSAQLRTDPRARAAFTQYFTLLPADARRKIQTMDVSAPAFLASLTSAPLPAAGVYTEYRRHSNGVVYPVKVTLPKGTRVFHTADRAFVVLAGSGDPVVPYTVATHTVLLPAPPQKPPPPVEIVTPAAPTEIIQQGPGAPLPTTPPETVPAH